MGGTTGGTTAVFFTPSGFFEPHRAQFRRLGLAPENKSAEGASAKRRERSRREAPTSAKTLVREGGGETGQGRGRRRNRRIIKIY